MLKACKYLTTPRYSLSNKKIPPTVLVEGIFTGGGQAGVICNISSSVMQEINVTPHWSYRISVE